MKSLKITGITSEKIVYVSSLWLLRSPLTFFSYWTSEEDEPLFYAEYSKKRIPIPSGYLGYNKYLNKGEVMIYEELLKELGITVGDKISITLRQETDNYLKLYNKKPKKFINYFSKQNKSEKKKILKELLEYDLLNEEAISYLDKHESALVREVGLE